MDESSSKVVLAVDCMGGDHGPNVTLAACARFIRQYPDRPRRLNLQLAWDSYKVKAIRQKEK